MSTITKQAVQAVADLKAGYTLGHADVAILNELARIALASLEAEAVCVIDQSNLDYLKSGADADVWPASRKEMGDVLLYRTAPPAPAKAEPVAWLWSHRKHPSEVTLVRPEDDEKAEGAHWSWWSCQALYAAPPAPVSVPDFPEILPCPVILEPGLRFDKGVPTKAMLGALQRRAEHYAELEAMTPEQRAKHDAGMKEFAAMLQGVDRPQNETQNIPENIPATQFKPVADLYGLTSPTGSETSFTFDAVEARDFIGGGWSCQEYVELERFQEAVSGNPPVTPDGWREEAEKLAEVYGSAFVIFRHGEEPVCADSTKFWFGFDPAAPDFRENSSSSTKHFREITKASTNCPKCGGRGAYHCPQMLGTVECECTFPAALRREVSGRIQEERAQIREEMVMGARLTRHRFKP
ncbi:hypothetical protein [uncultured Kluyvera sp.]|jgi:hypothetical protein|uniref:Uncharacterized protein n=1 Tax=Siphoviridae sp. ctpLW14 TaxID=2826464 RepID=A0A8S5N9D6_9CAUD|nr:hypothetical protein [uncultured Kluyvera sp.]DAD90999.1 MAG TPA: hypothetical protein [Siphoviridae sp. ctpLW14]